MEVVWNQLVVGVPEHFPMLSFFRLLFDMVTGVEEADLESVGCGGRTGVKGCRFEILRGGVLRGYGKRAYNAFGISEVGRALCPECPD